MPTYDSHYVFAFLYHSRDARNGVSNGTRFADKAIDAKIDSLTTETDIARRNATIAEIWAALTDALIYLPLHHQTLAFAMKSDIDLPTTPENRIDMKLYGPKK